MTQECVADAPGVIRRAVSKWESGASDPSPTNLTALADLFETISEDILKEIR